MQTHGISVRQAVLAELQVLAPLFDGYRKFHGRAPDRPAAVSFLRERFDHGESIVFLACAAGVPAGFTQR